MKNALLLTILIIGISAFIPHKVFAQKEIPDTVTTGIYITSVHDIDFKLKKYTVSFWLWLKYKNKDFNFIENLEVPQAQTVTKSFSTIDTSDGQVYILMKLQCEMKDSWQIDNFPFDRQQLNLSIENSQFDSHAMVFVADTLGKHFDPQFTLNGWTIDKFEMKTATKAYETTFGDTQLGKPHSEYSAFRVNVDISREALGLFWKMFLGMYVAFLIAFVCFFIHTDSIDSRFNLSVGALFAVIGNKYIIDSALPESVSFTLVDTLHGLTLLFILAVITCNVYSLKLVKHNKIQQVIRFDKLAAIALLMTYLILNIYFIFYANS